MLRTHPENNLQNTGSLSNLDALTIDFVYRFGEDMRDLQNVLGIVEETPVVEGYTIKTKKADVEVDLKSGVVAEGEIIPLSKVEFKDGGSHEITSNKWRKVTTYEAIQRFGQESAVNRTDAEINKKIRAGIQSELFAFLRSTSTLKTSVKEGSFQGAVAAAWGYLEQLFQSANETIVFANPLDVAVYLGTAQVTQQTAFGITYLEAFAGTKVIVSNFVQEGEILATVPSNLNLYTIVPTSEGGSAFGLRSDESGFIGLTRERVLANATIESLFISGIKLLPEVENGIIRIKIGEEVTPDPKGA